MTDRELFKQTFDAIHASKDTVTEVMKMAKSDNIYPITRKKRHPVRTLALIAAAAALLVTGAFAAAELFGLRTEPVGQYGMKISADYSDESAASGDAIAFTGGDPALTHCVNVTPTYLPEGMENVIGETMKFWFKDNNQAGFSISQHMLNTGKASFCKGLGNVQSQESLNVDGREAVWIQYIGGEAGTLYISYPEHNVVLEIIFTDMDKDTALRVAEGLTLTDSGETFPDPDYLTFLYQVAAGEREFHGGDLIKTEDGYEEMESSAEMSYVDEGGWISDGHADGYKLSLSKSEMNAHAVGESFPMRFYAHIEGSDDPYLTLDMKVTDAAVADDLSILIDPSLAGSYLTGLLDENGKLPMNTIEYIKSGDGINSLSTVVATEEHPLKLVAVTMDITNNTGKDIEDTIFYGALMPVEETGSGYALRHDPFESTLPDGTAYDYRNEGVVNLHEMDYYSIHDTSGKNNGGNHMALAAGETVTLQIAWLVNNEDVPYLYLDMNGSGSLFTQQQAEYGYVKLFD